jgi:hypothetical protein
MFLFKWKQCGKYIFWTCCLLKAILLSNSWKRMSSSRCEISHILPSWPLLVVSQPSSLVFISIVLGILESPNSVLPESKILRFKRSTSAQNTKPNQKCTTCYQTKTSNNKFGCSVRKASIST